MTSHKNIHRGDEIKEQLKETISQSSTWPQNFDENQKSDIQLELAKRESLKNQAFEQDIRLKKLTLLTLFSFLSLETIAVFLFAYWQGVEIIKLEEWSFKLLLTATIVQITYMLQVAVKHLFPDKKGEKES